MKQIDGNIMKRKTSNNSKYSVVYWFHFYAILVQLPINICIPKLDYKANSTLLKLRKNYKHQCL